MQILRRKIEAGLSTRNRNETCVRIVLLVSVKIVDI